MTIFGLAPQYMNIIENDTFTIICRYIQNPSYILDNNFSDSKYSQESTIILNCNVKFIDIKLDTNLTTKKLIILDEQNGIYFNTKDMFRENIKHVEKSISDNIKHVEKSISDNIKKTKDIIDDSILSNINDHNLVECVFPLCKDNVKKTVESNINNLKYNIDNSVSKNIKPVEKSISSNINKTKDIIENSVSKNIKPVEKSISSNIKKTKDIIDNSVSNKKSNIHDVMCKYLLKEEYYSDFNHNIFVTNYYKKYIMLGGQGKNKNGLWYILSDDYNKWDLINKKKFNLNKSDQEFYGFDSFNNILFEKDNAFKFYCRSNPTPGIRKLQLITGTNFPEIINIERFNIKLDQDERNIYSQYIFKLENIYYLITLECAPHHAWRHGYTNYLYYSNTGFNFKLIKKIGRFGFPVNNSLTIAKTRKLYFFTNDIGIVQFILDDIIEI